MIGIQAPQGGVAERFAGLGRDFISPLTRFTSPGGLILQIIVAGVFVEAILGLRVWAQLTSQNVDAGLTRLLFSVSGGLVSPFVQFEPSTPIKPTGIIEISTLVAMEVYLVATVAAIVVIVFAHQARRFLSRALGARTIHHFTMNDTG